jgi:hypothetical protein
VKEWRIKRRSLWLVILDGLDEPDPFDDYDWFISRSGVGNILVTSRQHTSQNLGRGILLVALPQEQGLQLLMKIALPDNQAPTIEMRVQGLEIGTYLGFLPLGLELAGSYIRHALHGDLGRYLEWIDLDPENFYQNIAADSPKRSFLSSYTIPYS